MSRTAETQPGAAPAAGRHCRACGYRLDHLERNRCPECGREFDPTDPASFARPNPMRRKVVLIEMALLGGAMSFFAISAVWFILDSMRLATPPTIAVILAVLTLICTSLLGCFLPTNKPIVSVAAVIPACGLVVAASRGPGLTLNLAASVAALVIAYGVISVVRGDVTEP